MSPEALNILLVEDDEIDAQNVVRGFRGCDAEVRILRARDGIEALETLRSLCRDGGLPWPLLLLVDLNMPRMNGIEFLTELRADACLNRSIVFVLTTSNSEADKVKAYNLNVAGYMLKSSEAGNSRALRDMVSRFRELVEFPPYACVKT